MMDEREIEEIDYRITIKYLKKDVEKIKLLLIYICALLSFIFGYIISVIISQYYQISVYGIYLVK